MPCPDCERMLMEICKDGRSTGGAFTGGRARPEEAFRPYGARFLSACFCKNERETAVWTTGCRRLTLRLKICCRSITFCFILYHQLLSLNISFCFRSAIFCLIWYHQSVLRFLSFYRHRVRRCFPTFSATLPARPSDLSAGDKMEFSGPQTAYLG